MVFLWSLSDSKSPQVFSILFSILSVPNDVVVWMVSTRLTTSKSFSPFSNTLVTVPNAPITIGIIVTFMFHSFLQFPSKVKVLILLLLLLLSLVSPLFQITKCFIFHFSYWADRKWLQGHWPKSHRSTYYSEIRKTSDTFSRSRSSGISSGGGSRSLFIEQGSIKLIPNYLEVSIID